MKGKRKKKANKDDGQKAETAQGGGGNRRTSKTNLHGETDLTKTAHTPKHHDTLRRGTRGELGTKWGTSWWQTRKPKQLIIQQDSVPKNLEFVRCSLSGTVVKSCPNWHKRLSSSIELGAQHVSPHQTTIKRKKATPGSVCLPDRFVMLLCKWYVKNWSCSEKRGFWQFGTAAQLKNCFPGVHKGPQEQRDSRKGWKTVRPTVSLYLNELPD